MDNLNNLRVQDLKEELKKRDLPVSGRKAELIARLSQSLEEASKAEQPASLFGDKAVDENDESSTLDAKNDKETEVVADKLPNTLPSAKTLSPSPADIAGPSTGGEGRQVDDLKSADRIAMPVEPAMLRSEEQGSKPATVNDMKGSPDQAKMDVNDQDNTSQEAAVAMDLDNGKSDGADTNNYKKENSDIEEAPPLAAKQEDAVEISKHSKDDKALAPMQAALLASQPAAEEPVSVETEEEIAVDFEADDVEADDGVEPVTTSEKKATSAQEGQVGDSARKAKLIDEPDDQPSSKRQRADPTGTVEAEDTNTKQTKSKREPIPMFKPKQFQDKQSRAGQQPAGGLSSDGRTAGQKSSVFNRIGTPGNDGVVKGPGAPPSRINATTALLVTGFVRPFRVPDAKALFQSHGELKKFWMSPVRDKAYIIFENVDAAEAARQAVHSLEWPDRMRTSLRPKFVPEEEAEEIISSNGSTLPVRTSGPGLLKPGSSPAKPSLGNLGAPEAAGKRDAESKDLNQEGKAGQEKSPQKPQLSEQKPLEELFKKTQFKPPLYWLPISEEYDSKSQTQILKISEISQK